MQSTSATGFRYVQHGLQLYVWFAFGILNELDYHRGAKKLAAEIVEKNTDIVFGRLLPEHLGGGLRALKLCSAAGAVCL